MVAMSHQCQQKRNRTRILRYFQAVLGEPKEKHRSHPAATTSRQAQESPKAGDPQKTVVKVKRKKTRRELNRAKFGKKVVEKLFRCKAPARLAQAVPAADQSHCRAVGSRRAPVPKPSLNPGWIITQNRLTQHMGIFNKEVKSLDIERLLKGQPVRERSREPAAEVATDTVQDRSCTPAQAEATASPQRPDPCTPLGDNHRNTRALSATPVETGGQQPPEPTRQEVPPPPPTTDLAQRLVRTLKPHRLFPGQNLVHNTQRQLIDILVERHGGQPGTWLPAELTRTPQSGFIPPDRTVAGGRFTSPTAQTMEDSFLLQSDGSVRGLLSSTASTVSGDLGCRKQDAGSFAGESLMRSLDLCPPKGSPPGGCAAAGSRSGYGGAFDPGPWPWSDVGGLQQVVKKPATLRSYSAGSSLARILEAHRSLAQERRSSPCQNPGKGLWVGEALAGGDGPNGIRQATWHDAQRPGREPPEGGDYRPCFPPASPWPFAQKPPLDGGNRPRWSWAGEKDGASPGPSHLLHSHSSAWLRTPLPENRARPRGWAGCREGPALPSGAPDWRASGVPISWCYPPSESLEWSDSPPPSWLSVAHRVLQKNSPEDWVFPRMRMY
ncbi:proline-rich protein 19 isoform X2 [Amblyraja radiata]|uniref:proline-rich protein 19 isoform X2 n=1 Tax=Amblyraja radiata TaxID=386614 RepID=UPI001403116F|nr:proline-rich protein 19 isoform X2 [Amblyraja radiata]